MIDKKQVAKLYAAAKLTETEQSVLEHLINNIDSIQDIGIRQVAQDCFTSMTTVMRLSKKLGYSGFREMTYDLKHLQNASQELTVDLQNNEIHFSYQLDDLKLYFEAFSRKRPIGINGEGYSRLVAEYMERKLVGLGVTAIMQDYLEADQFIGAFHDQLGLMMLVSKSGKSPAIIEMARECQKANILTAAFTGNPNSDLAREADILFTIKDDHPFDIKNAQPNCFAGYCILAFEELIALSLEHVDAGWSAVDHA